MTEMRDGFFKREWLRSSPLVPAGCDLSVLEIGHFACPEGKLYPEELSYYTAITWCVEGELTLHCSGFDHSVPAGTAMVIAPGLRFSTSCIGERTEFHYVAVDGERSADLLAQSQLWEGVFPFEVLPSDWLSQLAVQIDDVGRQKTLVGLVHTLFQMLRRDAEKQCPDKLVWRAESILQSRWNHPDFTMQALAKELDVTRSTLATRFQNVAGVTPHQYLDTIRYRHAVKLLSEGAMQCSEVALACGFADPNYFSRWYKKIHGTAPSAR